MVSLPSVITRDFALSRPTPAGDRAYRVMASSPQIARDGVQIPTDAWELERFRQNPVLTWGHPKPDSPTLPIGTVPEITRTDAGLEALIEFADPEIYPFAGQVERMWGAGYVRAVSVTALLKGSPENVYEGGKRVGIRYAGAELTSLGVVPVGSDSEALAVARAFDFTEDDISRLFLPIPIHPEPDSDPLQRERNRLAAARA